MTRSHLVFAQALCYSISRFRRCKFHALVVDDQIRGTRPADEDFIILTPDDLSDQERVGAVRRKHPAGSDRLRWSLKPVLLSHCLAAGFDAAIYCDHDLFFFRDPGFLEKLIHNSTVLLCPHWRNTDPAVSPLAFERNFTDGVFNGGLVGVSTSGRRAMDYWADACAYKCNVDRLAGIHDDQKYLDLIPAIFEKVAIIHHRGCNLARWNRFECRRTLVGNKVVINGEYEVVFIHFTVRTIASIKSGEDALLAPYLEEYENVLHRFDSPAFDVGQYLNRPVDRPPFLLRKMRYRVRKMRHSIASVIHGK